MFSFHSAFSSQPAVHVLRISDVIISPAIQEYISGGIKRAEEEKAECLIIELDTPGGLLDSTRVIVRHIMNASVPVVVYVSPKGARAGSAGVFLTLAAHVASMAPSTHIGAAHPVIMGERGRSFRDLIEETERRFKGNKEKGGTQKEESGDPMQDKIMNDVLAWVRAIASERGRNVEWAENAVRKSFSETADEALKLGVIDFLASDVDELIRKIDGREVKLATGIKKIETSGAKIADHEMSLRQKVLAAIANPNIAFILMLLGFYGLLFEFTNPGIGFSGIGGAICLILAFYSFQALPVNYAGFSLILLAVVLFVAEVKITSYGLLTVGGILSFLLGSLLLIDSRHEFLQLSLGVVLPFVAATALLTVFLVSLAVKAQRRKVTTGAEGLVGKTGDVVTELNPEGYVFVEGALWRARADRALKKGEKVKVLKEEHLTLIVKKEEKS